MPKQVVGYIKLQVPAGKANPAPPIGPALGQQGINIQEFCKTFNDKTKEMEQGIPIPVVITVYVDRTFSFEIKTSPTSFFIKKAVKLNKGSSTPGLNMVGKISMSQVEEIAEKKLKDLNSHDINSAKKMVMGSARSMGIEVIE